MEEKLYIQSFNFTFKALQIRLTQAFRWDKQCFKGKQGIKRHEAFFRGHVQYKHKGLWAAFSYFCRDSRLIGLCI